MTTLERMMGKLPAGFLLAVARMPEDISERELPWQMLALQIGLFFPLWSAIGRGAILAAQRIRAELTLLCTDQKLGEYEEAVQRVRDAMAQTPPTKEQAEWLEAHVLTLPQKKEHFSPN